MDHNIVSSFNQVSGHAGSHVSQSYESNFL